MAFAKMRMVRYGTKLFWIFELDNKSTQTLTHEEFRYFLEIQQERTRNGRFNKNSKIDEVYLSSNK